MISPWFRTATITVCLLLWPAVQGWAGQNTTDQPLTVGAKMSMSVKESVDWPILAFNGGIAYLYYEQRDNPSFGYGWSGYGKRYAGAMADSTIGNVLGDGVFPSLLHEDPRYVRKGTGPLKSRIVFSLRQTIKVRTDSGQWRFAYSQWLGAVSAQSISNLYYPNSRTVRANLEKFELQIAGNAGLNLLQEFWPDLAHRFFTHHH